LILLSFFNATDHSFEDVVAHQAAVVANKIKKVQTVLYVFDYFFGALTGRLSID